MAYGRIIIARSKLFYKQNQRFTPSLSHISNSSTSSDREELPPLKTISPNSKHPSPFLRYNGNSMLSGNASRHLRSSSPAAGYGLIFHRNISNVVADKVVEAAPVMNEVALAAADSLAPVAAFQHLIGYVHCYTGLEWWASIAATTALIRFIMILIRIDYVKHMPVYAVHTRKIAKLVRERAIMAKQRDSDPKREDDLDSSLWKTFRAMFPLLYRHSIPPVCAAISLFFAVYNMAEKVPSFRTGGTLWFTDLTTPDRLYLPILMALSWWTRKMLSSRNPASSTGTNLFYPAVSAAVTVALGFTPAVYCFMITSNLIDIAFTIAVRNPRVMKLLMSRGQRSTGK